MSRSRGQPLSEEVKGIEPAGLTSFPGIAVASWVGIAMSKEGIGIPFCEVARVHGQNCAREPGVQWGSP